MKAHDRGGATDISFKSIRRSLDTLNQDEAANEIARVASLGAVVIPTLRELLDDEQEHVRFKAAQVLVVLGGDEEMDLFIRSHAENWPFRVINWLYGLGTRGAVAIVRNTEFGSPWFRVALEIMAPKAHTIEPALLLLVDNVSPEMSADMAVYLLGHCDTESAYGALEHLLSERDADVDLRMIAAWTLAANRRTQACEAFGKILLNQTEHAEVRFACQEGLKTFGGPRAESFLNKVSISDPYGAGPTEAPPSQK